MSVASGAGRTVEADYATPVLTGDGATDYARYLRTDALLALQRSEKERVHRDELLFQTVHQATELWLQLACHEVAEATRLIGDGRVGAAELYLGRAALAVRLVTEELEMLRRLAPRDFQIIRTALGHGSGFESPGWRRVRRSSGALGAAFSQLLVRTNVDLIGLYRSGPADPLYRLAEAMVDWDERVAVWRIHHYTIATRIIGPAVVGTKGTPVDTLAGLVRHRLFPDLWRVRTDLTLAGTAGQHPSGEGGSR